MPRRNKKSRSGKGKKKEEDKTPGNDSNDEGNKMIPDGDLYQVKHSPILGRYLAARKAIKPGDVIISEKPIIIGPSSNSKAVCLGCYKDIVLLSDHDRCESCKWPICSRTCSGIGSEYGHTPYECERLGKLPDCEKPFKAFDGIMYNAILPLRCLLLRESQPEKWRDLQRLESHNDLRQKIPEIWQTNQTTVVERIRNKWGFDEFSEEEIHTVCGYLEVNSFGIGQGGVSISGLYPTSFLFSHDCISNTSHIDDETYRLTVRASVKIPKGEAITLSYAHTLQGTLKRREHLRKTKFFECSCQRCSDRTELGTNFSAMKCCSCSAGCLLPEDPLDEKSVWSCQTSECNTTMKPEDVISTVNRVETQLKGLEGGSPVDYEKFLRKYEKVFHSNHFLLVEAKMVLSQYYGKVEGFLLHEMPEKLLKKKLDICYDVMKLLDVFEPGLTRIRGITLYETHAPLMVLSKSLSNSPKLLKNSLREVVRILKESHLILSFEPEASQEGATFRAIEQALEDIKSWNRELGGF